jgi:hypothetical protein
VYAGILGTASKEDSCIRRKDNYLLLIPKFRFGNEENSRMSFLRMQESQEQHPKKIPACAGMTIFGTLFNNK